MFFAEEPADDNKDQEAVIVEEVDISVAEWLPESIKPYWDGLLDHPLLLAGIIIVIGFVIGKLVQFVFTFIAGRIAGTTQSRLDDQLIELLRKPIFTTVFYLTLMLATEALQFSEGATQLITRLIFSLLILSWLMAGLRAGTLLLKMIERSKRGPTIIEPRTLPLFDILIKLVLIGAASYSLLLVWGVNLAAWLASAGIIGIAVGFAAKDTLANLFSGIFIIADSPYKIGDYIQLDTGERGQVTHVGLRSTRLLTRDDVEVTIPNAVIGNAKILNESGGPSEKSRIRIAVGVAYGADVDQVCEVLVRVAHSHDKVCKDPEPRARMRAFGASSLDFDLLCWIDRPEQRGLISHEMFMDVYKALNREGIEIPYSKQDLYIKELPAPRQPD